MSVPVASATVRPHPSCVRTAPTASPRRCAAAQPCEGQAPRAPRLRARRARGQRAPPPEGPPPSPDRPAWCSVPAAPRRSSTCPHSPPWRGAGQAAGSGATAGTWTGTRRSGRSARAPRPPRSSSTRRCRAPPAAPAAGRPAPRLQRAAVRAPASRCTRSSAAPSSRRCLLGIRGAPACTPSRPGRLPRGRATPCRRGAGGSRRRRIRRRPFPRSAGRSLRASRRAGCCAAGRPPSPRRSRGACRWGRWWGCSSSCGYRSRHREANLHEIAQWTCRKSALCHARHRPYMP